VRRWLRAVARRWRWAAALLFALAAGTVILLVPPNAPPLVFPDGKRFALSIIDDTDMATVERLRPVYEVLEKYGLRTTKTVWALDSTELDHPANHGDSLQDPEYRVFIEGLRQRGFEIALHGVRGGSSLREDTIAGLEEFRRVVGDHPRMQVNHSLNQENLYWGADLYALAPIRWLAGLRIRFPFSGHTPGSGYFWGDIARERIQYVRRFTYADINLYKMVPSMPYRLADKPYVNYWFPTANGDRVIEFEALLSDENIARLEREGGICLVYAHLGSGSFNSGSAVNPRFEARIKQVASRPGWFVPASEILDFLAKQPAWTGEMSWRERTRTDVVFLAQRVGLLH
jgi:hypothetical protein